VRAAGADLINDSWGGWDAALPEVAAEFGAGLVCSHAAGQAPRTRPFRFSYPDVVADVLAHTGKLAARAVEAGVDPESGSWSTRRTISARTPGTHSRSPGGWAED